MRVVTGMGVAGEGREKEEEDGQWWSTRWTSKKKERNWKLGMAGKHAFKLSLSLRWRP
jgi:hypothetical protein